ncbi:AlkZ-related protein [Oribacterium sp. HCP28S3_H8]|uniref:AlkZ-related protein n=1 Tax=Oribacterium sp. HCP28S3_H8 TaxID=3438945 RepID=UPI003F8ACE55
MWGITITREDKSYGWAIVVLATPEHIFGREQVTAAYSEEPKDSLRKIVDRVKEFYPEAAEKVILKLAGSSGTRTAMKKGKQS